jgi:hypothetical protein
VLPRDFAERDNLAHVIVTASSTTLSRATPARRRVRGVVRREDAERFIEQVRGDEPELRRGFGSRSRRSRRAG